MSVEMSRANRGGSAQSGSDFPAGIGSKSSARVKMFFTAW
jgi:hypothetical protein